MLINLRNALMAGKRLPYDAEVEYLAADVGGQRLNTPYIDTGVYLTGWSSVAIGYQEYDTSQYYPGIFSSRKFPVDHNTSYTLLGNDRLDCGYGATTSWTRNTNVRHLMLQNTSGALTITLDDSVVRTVNIDNFTSAETTILFADRANVGLKGAIYYFRIWNENGTLVFDGIPVRKGTVGYLYDRVSGKLFGNAGSGDFVLGPDVVPVEYLQSTGTQWIDTATPTADKYTFECLFTNATTDMKLFGNSYAYGRHRDLSIYQSRYRGTSIATSSNEWDRIEIDVAQPRLTVTRSGSTVGSATSWWSAYTGATPDTQYGTALPFGGHINAYGSWYGTNRVTCFYAAQGVRLRTRLFESWLGSELIEKLIPVRIGTEGAMMDVLTRRIYRNAGRGAFVYGNDLKYPIPAE